MKTYYAITKHKDFWENYVYETREQAEDARFNVDYFYKIKVRVKKLPASKVPEDFEIVEQVK